jgi:hypothetical protein
MQKNIIRLFLSTVVVSLFVGCNIYAPFTTTDNDNDYIEAAQKCLKTDDIGCAINNYQLLSDPQLKNEKLCVSYLSRSGFTSKILVDVVEQNSGQVLGNLSDALIPWTSDKTSDAVTAAGYCNAVTGSVGTLLQVVALFVDCALRIAKTDLIWGSSPSDTVCTTPNPAPDGKVTSSDIGSSGAGMCSTDITLCAEHIVQIAALDLNAAGLGNIATAVSQLPAALKDPSVTTIAGRAAIQSTLSN